MKHQTRTKIWASNNPKSITTFDLNTFYTQITKRMTDLVKNNFINKYQKNSTFTLIIH